MIHRSLHSILLTVVVATLILTSCANERIDQPARAARRAWIVPDLAALVVQLSPAMPVQLVPAVLDAKSIAAWRNPARQWMTLEADMVSREWISAPRAARCYALLSVAINDALLVADAARTNRMDVSDDAVIASVAERVMTYNHPTIANLFQQKAAEARWVGVWAHATTPAGVAIGHQIGQLVAKKIISWAQHDGGERFTDFTDPTPAPGVWQRTPPHLWSAIEPGWGKVRPIGIPSAASMAAAAPPAWESAVFTADRAVFATMQQTLTAADRELANKWAGGAGSPTPAGVWLQIASNLIEQHQLNTRQAANVYATLSVAMHDGFIACWYSKYLYLVERPMTWMRETNPTWLSYIDTPAFPSYPSGHATVSGSASTVLATYFPEQAAQLQQWAEDASRSRIAGGIHWPIDGRGGLAEGRLIGDWVVSHPTAALQTAITQP